MHTLLIHQMFNLPDAPGGTRHFELCQYCLACGCQFSIVASNLNYKTGKKVVQTSKLIVEDHINGLHILRTYTYPSVHLGFIGRVLSFISFMLTSFLGGLKARKIDLVMGTSPPIFQAISAWLLAAIRRKPFLLEIRDLWPEFAIDLGVLKNPLLIRMSRWLERFLYRRATHLLVNSPAYQEYLIHKGIPASKITLIPNGVDTNMFHPEVSSAELREAWNCREKFIVMYAGGLTLAYDIPTILRAAHQLQDESHIHFILIGDGNQRNNLERMAQDLKLTNVTFVGSLPKSQMPNALTASDACIATLKNIALFRTTYPNKVFEYMASGRPTILAIDGVIREVVEAAGGGIFVPPGNDSALAEAVRRLYQNRSEAQAMGTAARAYVSAHFERQHHARAFAELLSRLINKKA